ncbi:MAG: hypothetical protein QGG62_04510, partial [Candidatus Poseidoniaceae archaeon]|nr:hypothetical protein [Candidatus Poseidoniaceae archaeon]
TVTSRESDFKAEVMIEFADSQFSPNVRIDPTGLADKEQLDATIQCNSPFDVDDDTSDDSASIIYEIEEASALSSSNIIWGASATIVLVGIYLFIVQRQDNAAIRAMVRDQNTTKPKQQKQQQKLTNTDNEVDVADEDEISIESEDVDETSLPSLIEEIPAVDDLTPSGRLDSIRKEINPDDEVQQESSIEDRMSKFFQ